MEKLHREILAEKRYPLVSTDMLSVRAQKTAMSHNALMLQLRQAFEEGYLQGMEDNY